MGVAINNAFQSVIDSIDNIGTNTGFWESLKNNLYPSKESIKDKLIDIDSLIPEYDKTDAESALALIKSIESGIEGEYNSFQALYDTGDKTNQWIAKYAQSTQGQIRSTEGVIAANKSARDSAIQYNASLKAQTLGAKAATVATKALSIAANMIAFALIGKGIQLAITAVDNYIHRVEKASEALVDAQQKFNDSAAEVKSLSEELEKCRSRIDEINALGGAEVAKDGELEKLQAQTKELENQLALKREEQRLNAI